MKAKLKVAVSLVCALATGALVSGCGGSDYDNTPAPATSEVPPSASASVAGLISYLSLLVVSSAENLEPVDTSMVTVPTDETSDPLPVN